MKRKPLLTNILIMLGYSMLFMLLNSIFGDVIIGFHWGVLCLHIVIAFIMGLVYLSGDETRKMGGQLLLAALVVAVIGHGLCFFNGLLFMGNMH